MSFGRRQDQDVDDIIADTHQASSVGRWVPFAVVSFAFAGFIGLAWYAYHSGTQTIREEDLVVIEADRTPIKEKPEDPGGMKFPNQDKTVFETFAGSGNQQPPRVERVLPPPEEPLQKQVDTSQTQSYVNEKLRKEEASKEAMIDEEVPAPAAGKDSAVTIKAAHAKA